ncbi:hypothetical protein L7F22_043771 [Adiantum nelumboides]|nr:hypothetical protein [Adiantum nelumboides]
MVDHQSEHLESDGKDVSTNSIDQVEEHDSHPQSDHIEAKQDEDASTNIEKGPESESSPLTAAPPIEQANPISNGDEKRTEAVSEQNPPSQEVDDVQPTIDKGKGRQLDGSVDSNLEQNEAENDLEQMRPEAPTPEPPVHVRYMLPIGGPAKKRPGSKDTYSSTSVPSLRSAIAGPSNSKTASSVVISDPSSYENTKQRSLSNASNASTIKSHSRNKSTVSNKSAGKKSIKRKMPKRRMSSSDIPERAFDQMQDEVFRAGIQGRRRSNTVSVRGEKAQNIKSRQNRERPKTAPALPDGAPKSLSSRHRSTLMIDGQMFTLDDDLKKYNAGAQSLRTRSDTLATTNTTQESVATTEDGLAVLEGGMKNPVAAEDEPMIYDADELDDVPPPGSYAIHPPSQRRLAEAADLNVYNEDGDLIRFGRLFEKQRTLVIFLRHWFCPFCQMFAQSIQKVDPLPLQRANLGMIVIGQGHWHVTKSYKEVMKIPQFVQIFSDPTRKIYSALGMTLRTNDAGPACSRPDYQTMGTFKASMVAIKKGVVDMPIRMPGDVKLLGGEFILGPGLQCSFTHRMVTTRGHLDLPRILVQAGCDLSLRTPKDVLAERDTGPRKPGSTRSVDRITARRIAKRLTRKSHKPATPKDTLMMKSRQAAEEAASGEGSTQRTQFGNRTMPPSLSKRFLRPSTGETGKSSIVGPSMLSTASTDDYVHVDNQGLAHSIHGEDTTKNVGAEWDDDVHQNDKFANRTRRKFIDGLQTGFSVTAGATVLAAGKAKQAASTVASDINTQSSRLLNKSTSSSNVRRDVPPLPRTSSADAYEAANLRQRLMNSDQDTNLELNGLSYAGSTVSLGRNRANTGYRQTEKLGEDDLKEIMSRTFSSPNLHENGTTALTTPTKPSHLRNRSDANTSPSIPATDYAAIAKDLESTRSPIRQYRTGNPLTSGSSTSLASSVATPSSTNDPVFRGTTHGVPLSLFERRILGSAGQNHKYSQSVDEQRSINVNTIKASPRFSLQNDNAQFNVPLSPTFGEDTDYKRLSREHLEGPATVGLFPNDTLDKPKTSIDAATTTSRNAEVGDKTPKGRIISLYADDFNATNGVSGSRPASSRQSLDAPPPVPPKSPRFGNTASASDSYPKQPPPMPNRAPMPAPTPAFAAILAAEEARRSGSVPPTPTTAKTTFTYANGSSSDLNTINNPSMPTSPIRPTSSMPGASPALFAGLPSLNGSSTSIGRSNSQSQSLQQESQSQPAPVQYSGMPTGYSSISRSNSQTRTVQQDQQPPKQSQPAPIQYSGMPSGNPLFQGAAFNYNKSGSTNGKINGHERNESSSSTSSSNADNRRAAATIAAANAMPREVIKTVKTNAGSSFLEDLESSDGFNRAGSMQDSHDNSGLKSPKTPMSLEGTSSSVDYDEEDDEDYGGDWGPLQARQNVIPANPKSSSSYQQQPNNGSSYHYHDTIDEEEEEADENWTENDTEEGELDEDDGEEEELTSNAVPPSLALFGGIIPQNAKKTSSTGKYVVKRVTSRPSTAPAQIDGDESQNSSTDDSSQSSGGFIRATPSSASARKIPISRLLRKPPQTAPSSAGRRLSAMAEEEEELEETTIDSADVSR